MRRLQDLVDRATGLDASSEDEDGVTKLPSTMQTKASADRHHDKKKLRKQKEELLRKHEGEMEEGLGVTAVVGKRQQSTERAKKSAPPETLSTTPAAATAPAAASTSGRSAVDDWEDDDDDDDDDRAGTGNKGTAAKDRAAPGKRKSATADGGGADAADAAVVRAAAQAEEKKRKKEERRKLRQQQQRQKQAEEEALLDAVLAHQADAQQSTAGGASSGPSSPNATNAATSSTAAAYKDMALSAEGDSSHGNTSLQHFVMACDSQQLDTRLERIRMFGPDAVEDVGDGRTPHRRADGRVRDTGSVSFFPPHHLRVMFVHSAFATPNRYRWVPYDSLGVYLTTEEGHGAQGQTWREYTLNCDSNAFQRALAELGACQDRMGGVQDLVQCLARNKVYHIPTLLQCVYAMEATGESAFAGELLDVALYQVGVILRRFALSGTWAQRRLPMGRGGNALLFQVLQRGVHAALKRGCLRTAFERTRCLLSLDQRDPCGMLLLLDYTALRAKRWVWLLEVRHRVCSPVDNNNCTSTDNSLERCIKALPNFAFSWALAKHFMEREGRVQSVDGRPSKVLRVMTEAQRAALADTPAAEALLMHALLHFPHAAVRLVNALGGVNAVCGGGGGTGSNGEGLPVSDSSVWFGDVVVRAEDDESDGAEQQRRLADLFVARHEELWKLNECVSLLRTAVQALVYEPRRSSSTTGSPASPVTCSSPLLDPYAYIDLTREAVLGVSVAPIPADLLRPDAANLAMNVDADGEPLEMDDAMAEQLMQLVRQNRDNAAVGPHMAEFMQLLERELGDRVRAAHAGGDGGGGGAAGAGATDLDWFDYDDEEAEDVETQAWFSVASGEDSRSDKGSSDTDEYTYEEAQ
jgi:hypothetical protein